jgi:(p)ppGpp synthase/HD superfamily hydrolase
VVKHTEPTGRILVEGEKLHYTLASCCNPVFPLPLLGYVTRGKGVTVHALGCRNVPTDIERYATCRWETTKDSPELLVCWLELRVVNRIGLISDVTGVIAAARFNIGDMSTEGIAGTSESVDRLRVEVPDLFALANLIRQLQPIPGVVWVRRSG